MAGELPHSKLLGAAAREALKPLGLRQKGRSRVWLDDRSWWVGIVEFQPSSFSRGTYLNVGAMWLWRERRTVGFDVGHRVDSVGFVEYQDDAQFEPHARWLASIAADRVIELRSAFPTTGAALAYLLAHNHDSGWPRIDAATAAGLAGQVDEAIRLFRSLETNDVAWWQEAVIRANELADLLDSQDGLDQFRDAVCRTIRAGRSALKLDPAKPIDV